MEIPQGAKTQSANGTTYVFFYKAFWNLEKKSDEHKRKYIGKLLDGEFAPNGKYLLTQ